MIRTAGRFLSYGEVWFDEAPSGPTPDILIFRQRFTTEAVTRATQFLSLVNDLTPAEHNLWQAIDKTTRYDIRRAEAKDGLTCEQRAQPSKNDIEEYAAFYDEFAASKKLGAGSKKWLVAAADAGRLHLSSVRCNDAIVVRHAYVACGANIRLYQSAQRIAVEISGAPQLAGRANRFLHWRDMIEFKRRGFTNYDWGGIAPSPQSTALRNINRFKREFGGLERIYYDWIAPGSLLGRLYMRVRVVREFVNI